LPENPNISLLVLRRARGGGNPLIRASAQQVQIHLTVHPFNLEAPEIRLPTSKA